MFNLPHVEYIFPLPYGGDIIGDYGSSISG